MSISNLPPQDDDDDWPSDSDNGWHSKDCNCWECAIDYRGGCWDYEVDNLTDKHNTFLEIENNYFMGWADRKISPNEALVKFFKCIELCDDYNLKYSSTPNIKDTNHELKLLKYHYNSLKFCVQTQYMLKKYNKQNSHSLLIYGYIRQILEQDFADNDHIVIPFCLVNLCVVFYDELITNYTKLLHLTTVLQRTLSNARDIEYVTLNDSKSKALILTDTISFILDYVEAHERGSTINRKHNELSQLLWNTALFLQMKGNVLWFKYAVMLCHVYVRLDQYQNSREVVQYIEDHQWAQRIANGSIVDKLVIAKYYTCKIQNILGDIATHKYAIDPEVKAELMRIYDNSVTLFDAWHGRDSFEQYELFFHYFQLFLVLNDYDHASTYLQSACKLYYGTGTEFHIMYDLNTDQLLLEYSVLLYVLMEGVDDWDWHFFHHFVYDGRVTFRSQYHELYGTKQYFVLNTYDLCRRFEPHQPLIHRLFRDGDKHAISGLLSLNKSRPVIDQFLFETTINEINNE